MNEATQGPEIKIVGYCRACGVGLDEANLRTANGTIYCAEHVPAESAVPPPPPRMEYSPYTAPIPPVDNGEGSPGVAFILGMIPGVGAIYNRQYVKGLVHILALGLLFAAADNSGGASTPFFVLLIPGFWFYMAFEAYHTARRRREGLPVDEFSGLSMKDSTKFPVAAILLIVFGVIFLLDNLNLLDLRQALRYWPVGMIALGVYLLYARMTGGSDEPR